jgi:hypothetical protein
MLFGEFGEKSDAGSVEFGDTSAERFAEVCEIGDKLFGERLGGGAEIEDELEAGLIGGCEEFKLVGYLVGTAGPEAGSLVEYCEEGFGGSPEDGCGNGALGDGEKGDTYWYGTR